MKSKLKILTIFVVMFFASFIPENNHELFGDWHCHGGIQTRVLDDASDAKGCQYSPSIIHNPTWHWGVRHWLWLFAGITFSVWTVIEVIKEADEQSK